MLDGDLVLITRDYPPDPFLLAIRKKDGTVAWKTELVKSTKVGSRTAHSTPVIWNGQIVLNRPGDLAAYSLQDGTRLWWFPTASQGTSSPTAGNGVLYVNAPGMGADTYTLAKLPPFSYALEKHDRDKDGKLSEAEAPANDLYFMKRAGGAR